MSKTLILQRNLKHLSTYKTVSFNYLSTHEIEYLNDKVVIYKPKNVLIT